VKNTKLAIVIPCYNEEDALPVTAETLKAKISGMKNKFENISDYKIFFVDDGSIDNTWNIIEELHEKDNLFCGIKLAGNRGHQNALLAGLLTAKQTSDVVISMDADLQDDVNAMDEMLEKFGGG
jgi:glycosyltransferase involved in cell wall biosynthesis